MRAIDVSNYTSELSVEILQRWQADGVGRVIIQAFPSWYPQFAEQTRQTQACRDAGMPFSNYVYDYLADPNWRDACLQGIAQLRDSLGVSPHEVHLDEEDTETIAGWPVAWVIEALVASVQAVQASPFALGEEYTGRWFWQGHAGDTTAIADLGVGLWDSDYDDLADTEQSWTPYGGWTRRRIKQYRGTSVFDGVSGVDMNALSIEEEAELNPTCDTYKVAIDHAVQRLWLELKKKSLTKTPIKEITAELFAALQA